MEYQYLALVTVAAREYTKFSLTFSIKEMLLVSITSHVPLSCQFLNYGFLKYFVVFWPHFFFLTFAIILKIPPYLRLVNQETVAWWLIYLLFEFYFICGLS